MAWIRRRLRMIRMKQWKTYKAMHKEMRRQSINLNGDKMNVTLWKNSKVHLIHQVIPNQWFDEMKLVNLAQGEVGILST